jgi:hypothetical protein
MAKIACGTINSMQASENIIRNFREGPCCLGTAIKNLRSGEYSFKDLRRYLPIFSKPFSSPVIFPKNDGRGLFRKILKTKRGQTVQFKEKKKNQLAFIESAGSVI